MNDRDTTLDALKQAVRSLVIEKGWAVNEKGDQNPQNVAMAMTVEMAELLENFQWLGPEQVAALWEGRDPGRRERVADEFADVMMYGLQLMNALDIDITEAVARKIERVRGRSQSYYADKRALREQFEKNARQSDAFI